MLRGDDFEPAQVDLGRRGCRLDLRPWPDKNRNNHFALGCFQTSGERLFIHRMDNRDSDRIEPLGQPHQLAKASIAIDQADGGNCHPRSLHFFPRRDHLGCAGDDRLTVLVDALAVEANPPHLGDFFRGGHRDVNRVSDANWSEEPQCLLQVDRPGPRQHGTRARSRSASRPTCRGQ